MYKRKLIGMIFLNLFTLTIVFIGLGVTIREYLETAIWCDQGYLEGYLAWESHDFVMIFIFTIVMYLLMIYSLVCSLIVISRIKSKIKLQKSNGSYPLMMFDKNLESFFIDETTTQSTLELDKVKERKEQLQNDFCSHDPYFLFLGSDGTINSQATEIKPIITNEEEEKKNE